MLYFLIGPLAGALSLYLYDFDYAPALVMGYALIFAVTLVCKQIVKKPMDRIRMQVNLITIIIIQIPFQLIKLHPRYDYSSATNFYLMLPIATVLSLCLNFFINMLFQIYLLVKTISKKCTPSPKDTTVE